MDSAYYLQKFEIAAAQIDTKLLSQKQMKVACGIWLSSVVLTLQKQAWATKLPNMDRPASSIFFSIWLNDAAIKDSRLLYNIHALKLRQLNGYSIASRKFATAFREKFKDIKDNWPNVCVDYGPQTLMQGWQKVDLNDFQEEIILLANQFLKIDYLIDDLLIQYKST